MTARLSDEERADRRVDAMLRRDGKAADKMAAREDKADQMIGELSSGKLYVYPVGGTYREGTRADLISFLIRNKYA